jgi:septal ring-binding cell division protein DamX
MSREAELYKDKIEVSLDGRQIFYLFFGGAVIVGMVFVLGVMVGRRVEARGHTDRAHVAATVDPLAALDRLEGGSGLSFQGALRGDDGPVSDVEKTIAAMPKKADAPKLEAPKLEAPKAVVPEKREEAKPALVKPEVKPEEVKPQPKPEVKAEVMKEEPKQEAKLEAKPAVKVDVKPDVKAEAKPEAKKEEPPKSKFTLQLSSFQDKAEAQAYLDAMKSAGYSAYITEGAVDGKQYFRVRFGTYKSIDAANDAKVELEKTTKKTAVVMKL